MALMVSGSKQRFDDDREDDDGNATTVERSCQEVENFLEQGDVLTPDRNIGRSEGN